MPVLGLGGQRWGLEARAVYLILVGVSSFAFALIFTVNLVYQAETVGLNPLQLVLVGTTLETVAFLCEVPTGVVADVYSRRLSVIIGTVLVGVGFVIEAAMPVFAAALLAQVIWGLGSTFTSGAQEAWLADEVGEERAGVIYLRAAQAGALGDLLGIGASVALASVRLNLAILAGGILLILLGVFLLVTMPEHGFRPAPREERTNWAMMAATARDGGRLVRRRPVLLTIFGVGAFHGIYSEGFDRLWTPHLLQTVGLPGFGGLDPVVWFGVIGAGGMLAGMAATEVARRRVDTASHAAVTRALFGINAALVAAVIGFGMAGNFVLALATLWAANLLRATHDPLYTAWLNQSIDSRVRATVLSMSNQVNAVGQIAGGPPIGVIGTSVSMRAALVGAGMLLAPALPLVARAGRQGTSVAAPPEEVVAAPRP